MFDHDSKGIVFSAVQMPIKKLGLNFCLNRSTKLYYCVNPIFKDSDVPSSGSAYLTCLNEGDFMGMQPRFSDDYKKLAFFGSTNKFITHSGNYQLKTLPWPFMPGTAPKVVIDYFPDYPKETDTFCGLFGYNLTYTPCRFLKGSSRFYLLQSEFKGQGRVYIVDLENGQLKWIGSNSGRTGNFSLIHSDGSLAVIGYSSIKEPPKVFLYAFSG